ncbi:MAG TPA: hemolysin family protein [Hypericibacter adhaerens]|uniref:hemolysin family protein n=1 Tax=Hypericibacter adhaerens TaxID=2602016 RepID=UPI002C6C6128|nr:hemolysin family protein [Hypericibacter adhaerens]HWA44888.1 hemolysin family protein [Hypericibacter adhaerens]
MVVVEVLIVLALIALNGVLALSELAIVSARRARLKAMAAKGNRGASAALLLAKNPGRFLSSVQIGITLVGILAGAFSGATLAERFAGFLVTKGLGIELADTVAFVLVVAVTTYLSLIMGELVPKQIALRNAEGVAARVARPMMMLARIASPLVTLLDLSSQAMLRLFGQRGEPEQQVTEEEINTLVAEAASTGVVEPAEHAMIASVMRLGDRPVRAVMTHRRDVHWLDLDADEAAKRKTLLEAHHSRLPVAHGTIDEVIGVLDLKEVLDACLENRPIDWNALIRKAPVVHENIDALDAIEIFKSSKAHLALVVDEYGTFEGLVTTGDILASIAGQFHEGGDEASPGATPRADGSWLVDGAMPVDEMAALLHLSLPAPRDYDTAAGLALDQLRRLPKTGETFTAYGWRFEIVDLDGRRIDKILATRLPAEE